MSATNSPISSGIRNRLLDEVVSAGTISATNSPISSGITSNLVGEAASVGTISTTNSPISSGIRNNPVGEPVTLSATNSPISSGIRNKDEAVNGTLGEEALTSSTFQLNGEELGDSIEKNELSTLKESFDSEINKIVSPLSPIQQVDSSVKENSHHSPLLQQHRRGRSHRHRSNKLPLEENSNTVYTSSQHSVSPDPITKGTINIGDLRHRLQAKRRHSDDPRSDRARRNLSYDRDIVHHRVGRDLSRKHTSPPSSPWYPSPSPTRRGGRSRSPSKSKRRRHDGHSSRHSRAREDRYDHKRRRRSSSSRRRSRRYPTSHHDSGGARYRRSSITRQGKELTLHSRSPRRPRSISPLTVTTTCEDVGILVADDTSVASGCTLGSLEDHVQLDCDFVDYQDDTSSLEEGEISSSACSDLDEVRASDMECEEPISNKADREDCSLNKEDPLKKDTTPVMECLDADGDNAELLSLSDSDSGEDSSSEDSTSEDDSTSGEESDSEGSSDSGEDPKDSGVQVANVQERDLQGHKLCEVNEAMPQHSCNLSVDVIFSSNDLSQDTLLSVGDLSGDTMSSLLDLTISPSVCTAAFNPTAPVTSVMHCDYEALHHFPTSPEPLYQYGVPCPSSPAPRSPGTPPPSSPGTPAPSFLWTPPSRSPGTPAPSSPPPRSPGTPPPSSPGTPPPRSLGTPSPSSPGTPPPSSPGTPPPRSPGTFPPSSPGTFPSSLLLKTLAPSSPGTPPSNFLVPDTPPPCSRGTSLGTPAFASSVNSKSGTLILHTPETPKSGTPILYTPRTPEPNCPGTPICYTETPMLQLPETPMANSSGTPTSKCEPPSLVAPIPQSPETPKPCSPGTPVLLSSGTPVPLSPGTPMLQSPESPEPLTPGTPALHSPGTPILHPPGTPILHPPGTPILHPPGTPILQSPGTPILQSPGTLDCDSGCLPEPQSDSATQCGAEERKDTDFTEMEPDEGKSLTQEMGGEEEEGEIMDTSEDEEMVVEEEVVLCHSTGSEDFVDTTFSGHEVDTPDGHLERHAHSRRSSQNGRWSRSSHSGENSDSETRGGDEKEWEHLDTRQLLKRRSLDVERERSDCKYHRHYHTSRSPHRHHHSTSRSLHHHHSTSRSHHSTSRSPLYHHSSHHTSKSSPHHHHHHSSPHHHHSSHHTSTSPHPRSCLTPVSRQRGSDRSRHHRSTSSSSHYGHDSVSRSCGTHRPRN